MINSVNLINEKIRNDPSLFVNECEEEYCGIVKNLAEHVSKDDDIKIVAIAGPSSSGKTTTAHLLKEELLKLNETVQVISLDDFYLTSDKLPVLKNGEKDFESVNSLDIKLLEICFNDIITHGKASVPKFDFMTKRREKEFSDIYIGDKGIVIVEGLHALNPLITDLVERKNIFKVYISVNKNVVDVDGNKLISSRQIRMIRRILRDEIFRNSPVFETLKMWNGVIEGERENLYKFKPTADMHLTTFHPYELGLYKNRFLKLKEGADSSYPYYEEFMYLEEMIEKFESVDRKLVPESSLLREFIG